MGYNRGFPMKHYIRSNTRWFWLAIIWGIFYQVHRFVSLVWRQGNTGIEHRLLSLGTWLIGSVVILVIVRNRAWRYGFLCVLVAQSLLFIATMISATSTFGAIALAVLSFIPLIPALSFFLQFRRAENVEVYGGEFKSKWTVWYLAGAVLLIVFLIFYLGSL